MAQTNNYTMTIVFAALIVEQFSRKVFCKELYKMPCEIDSEEKTKCKMKKRIITLCMCALVIVIITALLLMLIQTRSCCIGECECWS